MHGQFHGRKKGRSIVIEAVCDEDLRIWHWFVGAPGSYNDVNVLGESPLYDAVQAGAWPPEKHPLTAHRRKRDMLYNLADGIYPHDPFLAAPFRVPTTQRHKVFNLLQEALRKDVERLLGVLTGRFHIALHPGRYRSIAQLNTTTRAVAILHNMIVEVRRDGYLGRRRAAAAFPVDEGGAGQPPAAQAPALTSDEVGAGRPSAGEVAAPRQRERRLEKRARAPATDEVRAPGSHAAGGAGTKQREGRLEMPAPAPSGGDAGAEGVDDVEAVSGQRVGRLELKVPSSSRDMEGAPERADEQDAGNCATSEPAAGAAPAPAPLGGPQPVLVPVLDPPERTFLRDVFRWVRTTDGGEHERLKEDLAEHIWQDRAALLMPYVG